MVRKTKAAGKQHSRSPARAKRLGARRSTRPEPPVPSRFPIVMIGASAGGVDAFKRFFACMPPASGMAFVLVPHLAPKLKSMMSELLSRQTAMPVREAVNRLAIQPDHVYVIPPNKYLRIKGRALHLSPVPKAHGETALDCALTSLALDQKENAIGIILSGTGSHGTAGLREIRLAGGLAIVQKPSTAQYDQMPLSALAGVRADHVLAPEAMPDVLVGYALRVLGEESQDAGRETLEALTVIGALLRSNARLDIRHYRKIMVMRRVRRRMGLAHIDSLDTYIERLRQEPEEVVALRDDLLIGVTAFFRQPEAFDALAERVLPKLIERATADAPLRAWIPACATGEEAYTIAMLLHEAFIARGLPPFVQIFATDIDEASMRTARAGIYPDSIVSVLTPQRLKRFFTRHQHGYQVRAELSTCMVFAPHNLISDPPFSRLDLISCRNVLIYLEPEAQARIISMFHFSLNEGGYLLLGHAESVGRPDHLFEPISKKWRIYRRLGPARRGAAGRPDVVPMEWRRASPAYGAPGGDRPSGQFPGLLQRLLLNEFVPASVLINRRYEILSVQGPVMNFLEFPAGLVTKDLLHMCRQGLRAKIRAMCVRARRDRHTILDKSAHVRRDGVYVACSITVRAVTAPNAAEEGLLVLVFQDVRGKSSATSGSRTRTSAPLRLLEDELRAASDDLRATIEDAEDSKQALRASNEEVVSMNEELQSANEELQSANEELETSKEELQSLNEELITVNNQLEAKVEDLDVANEDMANLMSATEIPIVFLDHELRIKRFTAPTTALINVLDSDIGRAFGDLALKFEDSPLVQDARHVIETGVVLERLIRTDLGRSYLRRILPYHSAGDGKGGVVITFLDITRQVDADVQLRRFAAVLRDSEDAIMVSDFDGRIVAWNRGAERLYGYGEAEALHLNVSKLVPPAARDSTLDATKRVSRGESVITFDTQRRTRNGHILDVSSTVALLRDADGNPHSLAMTERDSTVTRRAEESRRLNVELEGRVAELRRSEDQVRAILDATDDAVVTFDMSGQVVIVNKAAERIFGFTAAEMVARNVVALLQLDERATAKNRKVRSWRSHVDRFVGSPHEVSGVRKDGARFPVRLLVNAVEELGLFVAFARDTTEYKAMQKEIVDISMLEQRRIGGELHDGTQQELTGLGLLAQGLSHALLNGGRGAEAQLAARLASGLAEATVHVRSIARGLVPVPIDREGLMAALAELARMTEESFKVPCHFECPAPVAIEDDTEATHLFRIAQEAVNNAIKHASATAISIRLEHVAGQLVLEVRDNGVGVEAQADRKRGLGVRLMTHRCEIVGGRFSIRPNGAAGTCIACALPESDHA